MKTWLRFLGIGVAVFFLGTAAARAGDLQAGELRAKDLVKSTVTIQDRTYRVTSDTVITDQSDQRIQLKDIAVGTDPSFGSFLLAEFVASGDDLDSLKVSDLPR